MDLRLALEDQRRHLSEAGQQRLTLSPSLSSAPSAAATGQQSPGPPETGAAAQLAAEDLLVSVRRSSRAHQRLTSSSFSIAADEHHMPSAAWSERNVQPHGSCGGQREGHVSSRKSSWRSARRAQATWTSRCRAQQCQAADESVGITPTCRVRCAEASGLTRQSSALRASDAGRCLPRRGAG